MTGTTSLGDAASGVADAYVEGPGDSPLLEITIGEAQRQAASDWPHADALISNAEGVRWSFADFDARVDRLAAGLLHLGLREIGREQCRERGGKYGMVTGGGGVLNKNTNRNTIRQTT